MVRCLNLETKRACTTDWKLNDKTKAEICAKIDVAWTDFDELF